MLLRASLVSNIFENGYKILIVSFGNLCLPDYCHRCVTELAGIYLNHFPFLVCMFAISQFSTNMPLIISDYVYFHKPTIIKDAVLSFVTYVLSKVWY